MKRISLIVLLLLLLTACAPANVPVTPTLLATPMSSPLPTETLLLAPVATFTPTISPTPNPYYGYSIEYLRSRAYGGGQIEFYEKVGTNSAFTRYFLRYPSDGLNIHGFANIPNDNEKHPVIIAIHGYIDPEIYNTFDYTTSYADALGSAGYIVLHVNLRGYGPSDDGDNLFRVGMAIDVLNLIALVKTQSGLAGDPLQNADPSLIGLWGHSMGGGISTRVLTVSNDVKAAVLYAAMTGDERKNYEAISRWSGDTRGLEELAVPTEELKDISPMYFFGNITAAVSIHHGLADLLVPVEWSMLTCEQLKSLGKTVDCNYYEDMPHTFIGTGYREFIQYTIQFFDQYLNSP